MHNSGQSTILVIGRHDERTEYDTPQSMVRELAKADPDTNYQAATLEELSFLYDGKVLRVLDGSGQDIARANGIFLVGWFKTKILEDLALSVATYAAAHNIPVLNTEAGRTRSRSKLSQCVAAVIHKVQVTPYVFAQDRDRLLAGIDEILNYPIIVKSVSASRGNDNHLVHSREQLEEILQAHTEVPFIAQTYVPNDGDYRIIVMGDEVRFVMHRQTQTDSHLNNTSQGGQATQIDPKDLPLAIRTEAIAISKAMHRDVTGVDIIVDNQTGKHYFLEVNNMPQLSTGSLVGNKMIALSSYFTEWLKANHDNAHVQ